MRGVIAVLVFYVFSSILVLQAAEVAKVGSGLDLSKGEEFIIVYPENSFAVEKAAAEELSKYIEKSIGAETVLIKESMLKDGVSADAYIGHCKFTAEQKFFIKELKAEGISL
jgi:hypothetical protein